MQASQMIKNITNEIRIIICQRCVISKRGLANSIWLRKFWINVDPPVSKFFITRWCKPLAGWVKLNTDGCSKGNPGPATGGSVVRFDSGEVLWSQTNFYGTTSNMVFEAKALLQGIQTCINKGVIRVMIEVDSLILKRIIEGKIDVPWVITYEFRHIKCLLASIEYRISHVFHEDNQAADVIPRIPIPC